MARSRSHSTTTLSRRRFLQGCLAASAAAGLDGSSKVAAKATQSATKRVPDRRPNFVVLITDDQRWDSLGCAGNTILKTPQIDALAAGGVRFRQSFTSSAICMSSRASILTGLYTRCHGIDSFQKPLPAPLLEGSYPLLLRKAGYRTGFVGKWGLGGTLPSGSFDYFTGYSGQGRYFAPGSTRHLTPIQADQAVEFLRGCRKDEPFCLSVSFKAPHVQDEGRNQPGIYAKYPYDRALESLFQDATIPPPRTRDLTPMPAFLDKTINRTREAPDFSPENYQEAMKALYRLLTGVDQAVGRIMDALRELGVEDNTVIVYSSDHGSFYGEHGFGGKWLMLEEAIRTPMIVCDPRLPRALRGTQRDDMVMNIDIAPTLLDLAGIAAPGARSGSTSTRSPPRRVLLPPPKGSEPAAGSTFVISTPIRCTSNCSTFGPIPAKK
jgi:arylsulfatase A-like enzyme